MSETLCLIICPFIDEYNTTGSGLLCTAGSDKAFQKKWGMNLFNTKYVKHGLDTIWNWSSTSGILPCHKRLRSTVARSERSIPESIAPQDFWIGCAMWKKLLYWNGSWLSKRPALFVFPNDVKKRLFGFETVTVMGNGNTVTDHADSMGGSGRYGDSDVQWMCAGRGISHSEMVGLRNADTQNVG